MKWHRAVTLSGITFLICGCVASLENINAPTKPWEGLSRTFEATPGEIYTVTKGVLSELNVTIDQENQDQGFILGKVRSSERFTAAQDFAGMKKMISGTILVRIDIKSIVGGETNVSVVAKRESLLTPERDADSVGREIIDGIRVQMAKITDRRQQVAQASGRQAGAMPAEVSYTPSDVDVLPLGKGKKKTNAYAVIVGIEAYRDLPKVDFATRDAETVKEYLVNVVGYPEEHVITRLNERATRSDFESYFERWLPNNVDKGAEVFVYYAGHGAPDPKSGQAYLVPYDGNPAFLETTAYPVERLYKSLSALPAGNVIVALDSCFSGSGGRSVIAKGARPMVLTVENPILATMNLTVLSAAQGNQISSAYPEKRHGLFTYFFLKGLQGEADANKDGAVELGEVFNYLKPQVERQARRSNQDQTPQLMAAPERLAEKSKIKLVETK